MIFVLIPIAWLTIIAVVVNACRGAARGDELLSQAALADRGATPRLLWRDGPAAAGAGHLHMERAHGARPIDHIARQRGGRCTAGS